MLRIVLACAALLLPVATFAQDLVTPSDRVNTHVNIRSAAADNASEIGHLEIGEALPLIGSVPRWYEVQLSGGQTGFVSKSWTTISRALVARQQDELRIHSRRSCLEPRRLYGSAQDSQNGRKQFRS